MSNDDQGKHGIVAEDALEQFCARIFGDALVLRSPKLIEKKGEIELADIIVLIDDTLIIIQSKSLEISLEEFDRVKFERIKKRHTKARDQLNRTLNAQTQNAVVRGKTAKGVAVEIDWSAISKRIGIVTLNLSDEKYSDPEFRFQYPQFTLEHRSIEVHSLVLRDIDALASEFDTAGDFLAYLNTRFKAIHSESVLMGNELDFLAFYKTMHDELLAALSEERRMAFVAPGMWEGYLEANCEERSKRQESFEKGAVIDEIIDRMIGSIQGSVKEHGQTVQESTTNYLRTIGILSKLTRIERAIAGSKILDKFEKVGTDPMGYGYFAHYSELSQILYVFVVTNHSDPKDRRTFLENVGSAAALKVPNGKNVLCLGFEGLAGKGAIETILLDGDTIRENPSLYEGSNLFREIESKSHDEWDLP